MIDGTGHVDSEKMSPLHNCVQMNQHCMFKKNLIWGLLLFWEKYIKMMKKNKLENNFFSQVGRPMLSYPIVFKPWMDSCNEPLLM